MKGILLTVQIPNASSHGVRQHQCATGFYHKSDTLEQIQRVVFQSFHVMYCAFFFFFFEHREGSCKSHTALQTKRPFFPPWNKTEVNGWFKKILPLEGSGESLEDRQKHIQSLAISHATGIGKCIGCREAFVWVRIPINFFHSFPISPAFLFFWDCLSLCRQFI